MSRYPALPEALHRLLEAGPWSGTPSQLYESLEPYRREPWPPSPAALSLWLRNHGKRFGIEAEHHHTGERRLLRLARCSNGLTGAGANERIETYRTVFASWPALEQNLPALVQSAAPGELYTLAVQATPDLRLGWVLEAGSLRRAVRDWSAQFPSPLAVWLVRGAVSLTSWDPPE